MKDEPQPHRPGAPSSGSLQAPAQAPHRSIVEISQEKGLDAALLYASVIDLAAEGLLTATCLDAAAGILLTQLGLPEYFFRNLSADALKRVLRAIAGNLHRRDGDLILRSEVSEANFDVDGGVQVRVATPENIDRMEAILNPIMAGHRIEYYFSRRHGYYTYLIRPEQCKEWKEISSGESPFAFSHVSTSPLIPEPTRRRYESFLRKCAGSVVPIFDVSRSSATRETRIMFREDFNHTIVPLVRRLLAEHDTVLNRAYWETYRTPSGRVESICSLYLDGMPERSVIHRIVGRLQNLVAIQSGRLDDLYVDGVLSFEEMLFAVAAAAFVHNFIHKESGPDRDIMEGLDQKRLRDALAHRVYDSDRAEYTRRVIEAAIRQQPDLVRALFELFDLRFNPQRTQRIDAQTLARELSEFRRHAAILLAEDRTAYDVFEFMAHLVSHASKTNFYKARKRSFAFRLDPAILDPLVFRPPVHGIFFVIGFYAIGTHMRAAEIARGGLRLIRVTSTNYDNELDAMALLNYALGPVAQRLKHKDIAESGAKGVIVPFPEYARDGLNAVLDVTDGIMDLIQPSREVIDYLGHREMIFFGPDEGTAQFMDAVALRARERGYRHWRTVTTGKSSGVPHDAYGLLEDGRVFGLLSRGENGTELQIEGRAVLTTTDIRQIVRRIGSRIDTSGMTTTGVIACLREVLAHLGLQESAVNMMMTGGPDGDLGANHIQSAKSPICLILDGGSVLYDPQGLDRDALLELAMARHTDPRLNTTAYPRELLEHAGFRVPRAPGSLTLPDGTQVEEGTYFHRNFLTEPGSRQWVEAAHIEVFVPCGGLKDTINAANVRDFLDVFRELRVIIEGANVFFDDTARDVIARETDILQIRDSTANKGGVTSSSLAEVLTAFLLEDAYEKTLLEEPGVRCELIRSVFQLISANAIAETRMLLELHGRTGTPLYILSRETSEHLLALQEELYSHLPAILGHGELTAAVLRAYVPSVLLERVGMGQILRILGRADLRAYRDALVTKKLAATALYRHAADWDDFLGQLRSDPLRRLETLVLENA